MISLLLDFVFFDGWINWALNLTSLSFFSILVSSVHSKTFSPSHSIWQGDLSSPFLFVIMVEGLIRYIKYSIVEGSIQGLHLHGIQPTFSHSQFVDDTMMMGMPISMKSLKTRSILNDFSEASGVSINHVKSQIFLFKTPIAIQNHISHILGFSQSSLPSKYLGIPLIDSATCNNS